MQLLVDKDFISIWYDRRRIVLAIWHGYHSPKKIKEGTELILHFIKKKRCLYGLNDAREAKGTFVQSMKLLEEEILPSFVKAGLTKIAYVSSFDPAALRSVERILEINDQYEAQIFEDYDLAKKWLLGELDDKRPLTMDADNRLVLKTQEGRILIDFADIQYIYSHEKGIALHCTYDTYYDKRSLKTVLTQLPEQFIQIHRSYIVNTDYITSVKYHNSGSYHLFLKDMRGIKIPVSKKHVPALKDVLNL